MKKLMLVLSLLPAVMFADPEEDLRSALDCPNLTFSLGGDADWYVQSDVVHAGTSALRSGPITDDESTYVETTVTGPSILSFWWNVSSESANWDYVFASVDGEEITRIGGTAENWTKGEVFVPAGEHKVRWTYLKDESDEDGEDCAWLDEVSVASAPEKITVHYVVNRGTGIQDGEFSPGTSSGELARPSSPVDAYEFAGWYLDEGLTQKLSGYLPLQEKVTVYAKWVLPVSLLNTTGVSLSSEGNEWQAMPNEDGGYDAVCRLAGGSGPCGPDLSPELLVDVGGFGTFSFDWVVEGAGNGAGSRVEVSTYDWVEDGRYNEEGEWEDDSYWAFQRYVTDESGHCEVVVPGSGRHQLQLRGESSSSPSDRQGVLRIRNVRWTPAPDTITVKYDTAGGAAMADGKFRPGATYGDLMPPPTREGYEFVSWIDPAETGVSPLTGEPIVRIFDKTALLPFAEEIRVKALWGLPIGRFSTESLAFANGGDLPWFVVDGIQGESGGPVARALVRGPSMVKERTNVARLTTRVTGYGTLTFKYRAEDGWEVADWGICQSGIWLTCSVDGVAWWSGFSTVGFSYGEDDAGWRSGQVTVLGDGAHSICWELSNSSASTARAELCDVVWTPAPESMTVRFDSDDERTKIRDRDYKPGDVYGVQPLPNLVRPDWEFLGWHEQTLFGPFAAPDRLVPFSDVTLVAKWSTSISAMTDAGLTFVAEGTDLFRLTNVRTPGGNFAAEVQLTGGETCAVCGPEAQAEYENPTLHTMVAGAGFLSFKYRFADATDWELPTIRVIVDGEEVYDETFPVMGEWTTVNLVLHHEATDHMICIDVNGPAGASCLVGDFTFEAAGPQKTLAAWADKYRNYKFWTTKDFGRFAEEYAARFAKDPADYEARILHAVCILGELAENEDFQKYAKTFGYAVDYAHCAFAGQLKLDADTAQVNEMADRAIEVAQPVLLKAIEDLEAIPADWKGAVKLSANEWPLDVDVHLDLADVLFAKASLQGGVGLLQLLGGYDLTVDWAKLQEARDYDPREEIASVAALPGVNDTAAWKRVKPIAGDGKVVKEVRLVKCGEILAVRMEAPKGGSFKDRLSATVDLVSARGELSLAATFLGSAQFSVFGMLSSGFVTGDVTPNCDDSLDGVLFLTFDLQGKQVALNESAWTFAKGDVTVRAGQTWCDGEWECSPTPARWQKAIDEQTEFLSKVRDLTRIANAKDWMRNALATALAADKAVLARTDELLHFIEYDDIDAERVDIARRNTEKALQALDADDVKFDLAELFGEGKITQECDFTLLPGGGNMRVYLGALFTGEITRDLLPHTCLDEYGLLRISCNSMVDPTFAGLFPEMQIRDWKAFLADHACSEQEIGEVVFAQTELAVSENSNVTVRVLGGCLDRSSSVKVYLVCKDATTADLDLKKSKVNGATPSGGVTFPVTLKWAAGELGEKTITLKAKKDTLLEGSETFALQLGGELGMTLGEARTCTVTIRDTSVNPLKGLVKNPAKLKGVKKYDVTVTSADEAAGLVSPGGSYYRGAKLTVKAKAKTGYVFSAWYDKVEGKKLSTSANYTFTVSKAVTLEARFSKRYYVRALADPADGATVSGSGWYAKGKTATLKAKAKSHFKFLGWYAAKADDPNAPDMTKKLSGSTTFKPKVTGDLGVFACYRSDPRLEIFKTSGGSVSGASKYAKGKTATLTAKLSKGYTFLGWYDAEGKRVSQATSYKYKMGAENVVFTAQFKKEKDLAAPVLDWNAETEFPVGVSYSAKPKVSCEAAVRIVKVTGLPAGLSYKSGKVSGAPTAVKTNTVSVTVALATNSKKTWTLKQKLAVTALPAWAKGTFNGGSEKTPMQATLTIGSTGKVSGKLCFANAVWTLSGTKYSKLDLEARTATLSLTAKKGTTKKTVAVTVYEGQFGGFAFSETKGFAFEAQQNLWKAGDFMAGFLKDWAAQMPGKEYSDLADGLTVKFGQDGTATAKLKVGKNTFSATTVFSLTAIGEATVSGKLYLYFAPNTKKKFKGAVRVVDIESAGN